MDYAIILNRATPFDQRKVAVFDQLVSALYGPVPEHVSSCAIS